MNCPRCGFENPPDHSFCGNCGLPQVSTAPDQARLIQLRAQMPHHLAEKLAHAHEVGERKWVTILFADVVGSTALAEKRDPEEAKVILEECLALMTAQVHRYEGIVANVMGDGLLAFFGAPLAHEDDPERAVRAALGMQESIRAYADELREAYGVDLQIRVGLHTGEVVVGEMGSDLRMDYTAVGDAVNLAARLEKSAPPGGVLISETTHRLVSRLFESHGLGPLSVKGREQAVGAYLVERAVAAPIKTRGIEGLYSPLVGRDAPLARLQGCLESLAKGKGQIVSLIGEVGLGKSRIVQELRGMPGSLNLTWLEGRSPSYGTTISYHAFLDLLRRYFGIGESEKEALARVRVRSRVRELFPDQETEIYPYLASLLSLRLDGEMAGRVRDLHPEALKGRIFVVVTQFFERLAQDRPVVLVFEDFHWADPTSVDLMKNLLASTDRAALMPFLLFRPERQRGCWEIREMASRQYPHRSTEIVLDPLTREESERLLKNLLAVEGLPEGVRSTILRKGEGNPFFLEEVIRALIDSGVLVRQGDTWRASSRVLALDIPETIQGVVRARIDGLEEGPKSTLQVAAVIGTHFLYRVLVQMAEVDGQLDANLSALQRSELITERARFPELEYQFKNELIQEVAYAGLLLERRREYHRRAARSIQELFSERLEEFYGDLARHYEIAGELEKALHFLLRAGDRARMAYAHEEAAEHYQRALKLLEKTGDDEELANTYLKLGLVYHVAGDYPRVSDSYAKAFELRSRLRPSGLALAQEGQTLRIAGFGLLSEVPRLDPGRFQWVPEAILADHLFEGLGRYDMEGNVVPAVAVSWQVLEGGRRYIFHLQPDLKWSDGTALTAHDFEYAWKRNLDPATRIYFPTFLFPVKGAQAFHEGKTADSETVGVKALDAQTLEVSLEGPTSYFPHLIALPTAFPLPRHILEREGEAWTEPGVMVSNGPFRLAEHRLRQSLVLERNAHYPGPFLGNVGRLEWKIFSQPREVVAAYERGEVDLASVSGVPVEEVRKAHPRDLTLVPGIGTWYVAFVVSRHPLSDARVRKALIQGLEREILARFWGVPPANGGFVPAGMPGHVAEINPKHNLKEAQQLLAEAGYAQRSTFPPLALMTLSGLREVAENIARQWRENLGLEVEVQVEDAPSFTRRLREDPPHVCAWGWSADYPDPDNFLRTNFHSRSEINATRWRSEAFDQWVDEAAGLTDQARRMALYRQADELLVGRETIVSPLTYGAWPVLVKPWVRGRWASLISVEFRQVVIEPH